MRQVPLCSCPPSKKFAEKIIYSLPPAVLFWLDRYLDDQSPWFFVSYHFRTWSSYDKCLGGNFSVLFCGYVLEYLLTHLNGKITCISRAWMLVLVIWQQACEVL